MSSLRMCETVNVTAQVRGAVANLGFSYGLPAALLTCPGGHTSPHPFGGQVSHLQCSTPGFSAAPPALNRNSSNTPASVHTSTHVFPHSLLRRCLTPGCTERPPALSCTSNTHPISPPPNFTRFPTLPAAQVFDAWLHRAPSCPQLYLYSDSDPLVDPTYVEEYMKVQVSTVLRGHGGVGKCVAREAGCVEGPTPGGKVL